MDGLCKYLLSSKVFFFTPQCFANGVDFDQSECCLPIQLHLYEAFSIIESLGLIFWVSTPIFSSPEPKAHGELIVYQSSRRPSVGPSVRVLTLSNKNTSTTSGPITIKF